jgi:hypothetical protein
MANLRIISDNAADRATLSASTTAGALGVANLQNKRKGLLWRATGTTARLGATWATPERIGGVVLPFCNLSPTAAMRVRVSNELSTSNLLGYSDNYTTGTGWLYSNVLITPYAAAAPEGSMLAAKLVEASATGLHEMSKSFNSVANRITTVSIFVKAGERNKVRLGQVTGGFLLGASAIFDLVAGTVGAVSHYGGYTGATARITSTGDGWFRCSITLTTKAVATWYLALDLVAGTNTVEYAGDGVSGAYFTHAQLEVGELTSYFPSATSFTGRNSIATFIGSNGQVQTAAANVARMQYNPLNLALPPILLLEPAATNLLQYSEGTVAQSGGGNVANAAVTIPGFANSIQFGDNSVARYSYRSSNVLGTAIGSTYTLSVFVMMDDGTAPVVANTISGDFLFVWEGGTVVGGMIQSFGNGLYRCSVRVVATLAASGNNGIVKYTTHSARGFRITGLQLQLGHYADSYIPTTSNVATRSGDAAPSFPGVRPPGYIDTWQSYNYDSSMLPACPAAAAVIDGFTPLQAASAYSNGGGAYARHWLPVPVPALGLAIDIKDPANLQGYVEAGRLVAGDYWSPANNPDYGASVTIMDASTHARTDAGDLWTDVGTRARKMPLQLSTLPAADRTALFGIVRRNGMSGAMLVSLFPESTDLELERDHTIFGRLSSVSAMSIPYFDLYSMPLEIEEL